MKARILQDNSYGNTFTDEFINERWNTIVNGQLVSKWGLTEVLPSEDLHKPFWNGSNWIEGATNEEIEVFEDSKYPNTITAMQFKLELVYSGIKNQVELVLDSLEDPEKTIAWLKYDKATEFDRKDLLIQSLGMAIGYTKTDINEFFLRASKR